MKTCSKCRKTKDELEFHFRDKTKTSTKSICKECQKIIRRTYYINNRASLVAYSVRSNKKKRDINREYVFQYLLTHPCIDCGESDPVVLEFDHREDKEYEISKLILSVASLSKLSREISKCDVRYSNCHRRKTAKDFNWWIIKKIPSTCSNRAIVSMVSTVDSKSTSESSTLSSSAN